MLLACEKPEKAEQVCEEEIIIKDIDDLIFAGEQIKLHSER